MLQVRRKRKCLRKLTNINFSLSWLRKPNNLSAIREAKEPFLRKYLDDHVILEIFEQIFVFAKGLAKILVLSRSFFDFFFLKYVIQHCFICRSSDFTVSEDAGIEPRTVATLPLTASRRFKNISFSGNIVLKYSFSRKF